MKPAMNSDGVILAKELFGNKKDFKNLDNTPINKNCDDTNHGKQKASSKKTSSKKTQNCYYAVFCEDAAKDMRLCAICSLCAHGTTCISLLDFQ